MSTCWTSHPSLLPTPQPAHYLIRGVCKNPSVCAFIVSSASCFPPPPYSHIIRSLCSFKTLSSSQKDPSWPLYRVVPKSGNGERCIIHGLLTVHSTQDKIIAFWLQICMATLFSSSTPLTHPLPCFTLYSLYIGMYSLLFICPVGISFPDGKAWLYLMTAFCRLEDAGTELLPEKYGWINELSNWKHRKHK